MDWVIESYSGRLLALSGGLGLPNNSFEKIGELKDAEIFLNLVERSLRAALIASKSLDDVDSHKGCVFRVDSDKSFNQLSQIAL